VPGIGPAAADITSKRLFAVIFRPFRIIVQKVFGRNQDSRCAVAALDGIPLAVGVNPWFPPGADRDAFDGLDRFAFALHGESGAGTADAADAHGLGAGKAEAELEGALQNPVGFDQNFTIFAVDMEFGGNRGDGTGVVGGKMVFQFCKIGEVLAADEAAELSQGGGNCFNCFGGFYRFRCEDQPCCK